MDHTKVWMLLQIAKEAMGHPKLKPVLDAATKELEEIAAELTPPPKVKGEPEPEVDRRV